MNNSLTKSRDKKVLFGVCGGLSDFFGIDVSIIRIALILGTIVTGSLLFWIYILLALVLPKSDN